MKDQKSLSSIQSNLVIPEKWQEKYLIKRIGEEDIEITVEERNAILQMLNDGVRFVQIGRYTLMLNAVKSIDPKWGKENIPPRPEIIIKKDYGVLNENGAIPLKITEDASEQREWDIYFDYELNKRRSELKIEQKQLD